MVRIYLSLGYERLAHQLRCILSGTSYGPASLLLRCTVGAPKLRCFYRLEILFYEKLVRMPLFHLSLKYFIFDTFEYFSAQLVSADRFWLRFRAVHCRRIAVFILYRDC